MSRRSLGLSLFVLVLCIVALVPVVEARLVWALIDLERQIEPITNNNKAPSKAAVHARELVHRNDWATLSTVSKQFNGLAYGNVVSYSDGVGKSAANSTGEIFFFLTPLDSAGVDLAADPRASVTISMAQEGPHACKRDVEDPTCWKLTLVGRVVPVTKEKEPFALEALFSKHPEMAAWPRDHGFSAYVFEYEEAILLDYYGGAKHILADEYYSVQLA